MQVTTYTHSCVRLELDGSVLVVDPGTWSEAFALSGCDARRQASDRYRWLAPGQQA